MTNCSQVIDEETDRLNRFIEGLSAAGNGCAAADAADHRDRRGAACRADARRDADARLPHRARNRGTAVTDSVRGCGVYGRSAVHRARQREQVRAAAFDDSCERVAGQGHTSSWRSPTKAPAFPKQAREQVFETFFRVPGTQVATTRAERASASGCRSLAGSSKRRAAASGSSRRLPARGRWCALRCRSPGRPVTHMLQTRRRPRRRSASSNAQRSQTQWRTTATMGTVADKSRVLVVDDEPQITRVLRTVLTSQGIRCGRRPKARRRSRTSTNGARSSSSRISTCRTWTASSCAGGSARSRTSRSSCCR